MNLQRWLDKRQIQKVAITAKTLEDSLAVADRDLKDCQVDGLSADRRFATAYNAALNLSVFVIRRHGYRVAAKSGHHKVTFDVAGFILGSEATVFMDYFDLCRRKRNKVDYDFTDVVSETEVVELIKMVRQFRQLVLNS